MTFEEWKSQKVWGANAEEHLNPDLAIQGKPGFQYPDGSVILLGYVSPSDWYTVVGRDELTDPDLNKVETFLWENHSKDNYDQVNALDELEDQLTIGFKHFCESNGYRYESMDEVHAMLQIKTHSAELEFKTYEKHLRECNDWMNKWIRMNEDRAELRSQQGK